jgi:hypothetical protein
MASSLQVEDHNHDGAPARLAAAKAISGVWNVVAGVAAELLPIPDPFQQLGAADPADFPG